MIQIQTHETVAGFQYCKQYSGISLRTGVRLYVCILCTKQFADAVDSQLFYLVHHLAATIVAVTGVTLCVFVGQVAAHRFHYLIADEVLRRNQFDTFQLALMLFLNELENRVVSFHII